MKKDTDGGIDDLGIRKASDDVDAEPGISFWCDTTGLFEADISIAIPVLQTD